ncbi:hypothetical protein VM1G_11445 [Cytospora mali]|uniref:Uncharacterized protein n=1 Tax=Cytospora mali TaxID=578113 RepID=A0A194VQT3_CYTMA|nr:hypothetical protein VM1G_11445 [Valsa mali]
MDHMSGQWGSLGRPATPEYTPDDEPLLDRLARRDEGGSPGRPATPDYNPGDEILSDSPGRPATLDYTPGDGLEQEIEFLGNLTRAAFQDLARLNERVYVSTSLTSDLLDRLALNHPTSLEESQYSREKVYYDIMLYKSPPIRTAHDSTILSIGGSSASWAIDYASTHPNALVTLMDEPCFILNTMREVENYQVKAIENLNQPFLQELQDNSQDFVRVTKLSGRMLT